MLIEVYQNPILPHRKDRKGFNYCADKQNNTKEWKKMIPMILLYVMTKVTKMFCKLIVPLSE